MRAIERPVLALSIVAGLGYPLLWALPLAPAAAIVAKGFAVGLLALAAALRARDVDGWLLAAVMALCATGDVLLEIDFAAGAAAFGLGHIVAIALYRRNRRKDSSVADLAAALLLPALAVIVPFVLLEPRPERIPFAAYGLLLGAMAASAWLSRFPRTLVAAGALLFLASDLLIALRLATGEASLGLPIWLLYYVGQLRIFLGVTSSLPAKPAGRGTMRSMVEGNCP